MKIPPQRPDTAVPWAAPAATAPSMRLTARERFGLLALTVARVRRGTLARMRRSRLLRWRYRSPAAEELLLAPPDLRAHDPSFADELAAGNFGLAGLVANLRGRSPFAVAPPSRVWARELHGFGWLRHLEAARSAEMEEMARSLMREWMRRSRGRHDHAWEPDVVARRLISWLSHADLLLDGAERKTYRMALRSITDQVTYLSASWRDAPDGYPRLLALIAIVEAHLCIAGHDHQLFQSERLLASELERQIDSDGGHISRNPWMLVDVLLDLLPLRRCFAARTREPPAALHTAIARLTAMVHHLRLGDGLLARFNGMGADERDALITLLAYDAPEIAARPMLRSGYVRLERGATIVLMDAASPPPIELAGTACAGCLSFELSTGTNLLLVNGGAPGPADAASVGRARATVSHNTMCLGDRSSAKLIRDPRLERQIGGAAIRHPDHVSCTAREADGAVKVEASHDGYARSLGLLHMRSLQLDSGGTTLEGVDRLTAARSTVRFAWDTPFAIHFHLHPAAEARLGPSPDTADLLLDSGEVWRLTATGAAISIEESVYFADPVGPVRAQQIVLRGRCYGAAEVFWTLARIKSARPLQPGGRRQRRRSVPLTRRLAETEAGFETPAFGRDAP
jgi:uncharacterized heparinase superfamily protein